MFLSLIALSTIIDFIIGRAIFETDVVKKRKNLLLISMIANLGILGIFKYFNFFMDSFVDLISLFGMNASYSTLKIILPVGISFYTFQSMSYTIDIYRKKLEPEPSLLDFANFVAFFPQLVAGPIERAKSLLPQIREFNGIRYSNLKPALILMTSGYIRKVVLSDNIAPLVDNYFSNAATLDSFYLVAALLLFSFQIYFDFSGYSEIARGLGKLFGINLMINFSQPYFSKNPSEFWSRWHISLSSWLRDYLYIPLGGNRKGTRRTYINLALTMLIGGLWHGASWNFVLWGALHGLYLVIYKLLTKKGSTTDGNIFTSFNRLSNAALFNILVLLTWLPFRSPNITFSFNFIKSVIFWHGYVDFAPIGILVVMLLSLFLLDIPVYLSGNHEIWSKLPVWVLALIVTLTASAVWLTLFLNQGDARPFIYFQF